MTIQFYNVMEERTVKVLEFESATEAQKIADYIDKVGVSIEFEDFEHEIKFDPIQNSIIFFIES